MRIQPQGLAELGTGNIADSVICRSRSVVRAAITGRASLVDNVYAIPINRSRRGNRSYIRIPVATLRCAVKRIPRVADAIGVCPLEKGAGLCRIGNKLASIYAYLAVDLFRGRREVEWRKLYSRGAPGVGITAAVCLAGLSGC